MLHFILVVLALAVIASLTILAVSVWLDYKNLWDEREESDNEGVDDERGNNI